MDIQISPYCEIETKEENFPGQQKFFLGTDLMLTRTETRTKIGVRSGTGTNSGVTIQT